VQTAKLGYPISGRGPSGNEDGGEEEGGGEVRRIDLREVRKTAVHDMKCLGAYLVRLMFFMGLSWGIVALIDASWTADGNPLDRPLSSVNISTVITVAVERLLLTFAAFGVLLWACRNLKRVPWQE
jgi:hypothetical protein